MKFSPENYKELLYFEKRKMKNEKQKQYIISVIVINRERTKSDG